MKRSRGSETLPPPFDKLATLEAYYKRAGKLGQGRYGVVFRGEEDVGDATPVRVVALKQCDKKDVNWYRVARNEVETLRALPLHPNIVTLLGVYRGQDDDNVYLALELKQRDLYSVLQDRVTAMFTRGQLKGWSMQLLDAVAHLHAHKIVHRDIKPQNILVDHNGHLCLADFGLARVLPAEMPREGMTMPVATLWYRAPEVLMGDARYTTAVDVWSVGCIVGELLLNAVLFPGSSEENVYDQLTLIWSLCGAPSKTSFTRHCRLDHALRDALCLRLDDRPRDSDFTSRLRTNNPNQSRKDYFTDGALQLIKGLLNINPKSRTTAKDALAFSYFVTEQPAPFKDNQFMRFPAAKR